MYQFIDKPFVLAGCDLGVIGQGESAGASAALAVSQ